MERPGSPALLIGLLRAKHGAGPSPKDEGPAPDAVRAAMHDFIHATRSGDAALMAEAFRRAFRECEAEPHSEGPNESEGHAR